MFAALRISRVVGVNNLKYKKEWIRKFRVVPGWYWTARFYLNLGGEAVSFYCIMVDKDAMLRMVPPWSESPSLYEMRLDRMSYVCSRVVITHVTGQWGEEAMEKTNPAQYLPNSRASSQDPE